MITLALIGYALFARASGQSFISAFLGGARRGEFTGSSAYLYLSPLLLGPAAMLLAYACHFEQRRKVAVYVILALQAYIMVPGGQRLALLSTAVPTLMFLTYLRSKRIPPLVFPLVAVLALSAIIITRDAGAADGTTLRESYERTTAHPQQSVEEFLTGNDTEMIDGFAVELGLVPESVAFRPGWTLYSALAGPVPRVLWPAKPVTADGILNLNLFGIRTNNPGVAYGFIGELYFDSGATGIGVGMFLFGICFGAVRRFRSSRETPEAAMLALAAIPMTVVLLRGSLALTLGPALFTVGPVLLFYVLTRDSGSGTRRAQNYTRLR